jgi:hypothetical protein
VGVIGTTVSADRSRRPATVGGVVTQSFEQERRGGTRLTARFEEPCARLAKPYVQHGEVSGDT